MSETSGDKVLRGSLEIEELLNQLEGMENHEGTCLDGLGLDLGIDEHWMFSRRYLEAMASPIASEPDFETVTETPILSEMQNRTYSTNSKRSMLSFR